MAYEACIYEKSMQNLPHEGMGVALVRNECFRSRILTSTGSTEAPPIVINTLFNVIDSLGNYIFINIYYNPISRILRGEIYRRRT